MEGQYCNPDYTMHGMAMEHEKWLEVVKMRVKGRMSESLNQLKTLDFTYPEINALAMLFDSLKERNAA